METTAAETVAEDFKKLPGAWTRNRQLRRTMFLVPTPVTERKRGAVVNQRARIVMSRCSPVCYYGIVWKTIRGHPL